MKQRTVVIVGGGVIGLSTAYQLARRNYGRIIVLDKGALGDGSSSRAAGISTGLLWSETGVRARQVSLRLFRELGRDLPGYRYHDEHGCLGLFSPALWPAREKLLALYDRIGVPYRILSAAELRHSWPSLHPEDGDTGLLDPFGGYSEPADYIQALAQALGHMGVEIREHEKVVEWIMHEDRLAGVRTSREVLNSDAVVSTVHAWTLPLLEPLMVQPPVKHFVHQRYLSSPLTSPLVIPPINADQLGGYIRPAFGNRVLLGVETADREEWTVASTDFRMTEVAAPAGLREEAVSRFKQLVPAVAEVNWESEKVGLISFSMDGEPILGPVGVIPGLYLGLAFHSGGFSYNPVAGLLLAEYVDGQKTSVDVTAFSPDRFDTASTQAYQRSIRQQKDSVSRRH